MYIFRELVRWFERNPRAQTIFSYAGLAVIWLLLVGWLPGPLAIVAFVVGAVVMVWVVWRESRGNG